MKVKELIEKLKEFDTVTDDKNYKKKKSFMDKVKEGFQAAVDRSIEMAEEKRNKA